MAAAATAANPTDQVKALVGLRGCDLDSGERLATHVSCALAGSSGCSLSGSASFLVKLARLLVWKSTMVVGSN